MIKVIFIDSTDADFDSDDFEHLADHKIFVITTKNGHHIMLPDSAVAVIGIWDEKNKCFT